MASRIFRTALFICIALLPQKLYAQSSASDFTGTWQIDLRPSPDADPYLKEFIVTHAAADSMAGTFYGAPFTAGRINRRFPPRTYFAFTTADRDNTYFHSGYWDEGKVSGVSYSKERNFVQPWSGAKK